MAQIDIQGLTVKYRATNAVILDNACASFRSGDAVLIAGENGTGKSSLLKTMLRIEMHDKDVAGRILFDGEDVLAMDAKALQSQRRHIAYLQQQDEYDALDGYTVADVLYDSFEAHNGRTPTKTDKAVLDELFVRYIPDGTKIALKSRIQKLSGGQKRLVAIIADICMFEKLRFFFIDEPLNNLDMKTVRLISNLLNRIHQENPEAVMVMVSHCRIFPFINRVFKIENKQLVEDSSEPVCNTCFGRPDEQGYYKTN